MSNKESVWIPQNKVSWLLNKFNDLARRAMKNGLQPPTCELTNEKESRTYTVDINKPFDSPFYYKPTNVDIDMVKVNIEGEMPVLSGWKFLSTIHHRKMPEVLSSGGVQYENAVFHSFFLDDEEKLYLESQLDELQACPPGCEHCNLPRLRNQTFILENQETGEQKQVGSTCIDDFLGEKSLKKALWFFEMDSLFKEDYVSSYVDNLYRSSSSKYPVPLEIFVAQASLIIDAEGFVSRANSDSLNNIVATADRVVAAFTEPDSAQKRLFDAYVQGQPHKQLDKAKEVLKFYQSIDPKGKDFIQNIKRLALSGSANLRNRSDTGLAGYMAEGFSRELERRKAIELEKASRTNEHFGNEKERGMLKLNLTKAFYDSSARFPYTRLTFKDDDGRLFEWTTSSSVEDFEKGKTYIVTATIKNHSEYKGDKITNIIRLKDCQEVEPETAPPEFKVTKAKPKPKRNLESDDGLSP